MFERLKKKEMVPRKIVFYSNGDIDYQMTVPEELEREKMMKAEM